jgi:hypothetical protein
LRIQKESAFLDSLNGAVVGAGAAADANIGIDDVLVLALRDSLDGAVVGTGAALDASIGDIESHDFTSIYVLHGVFAPYIYSSTVF